MPKVDTYDYIQGSLRPINQQLLTSQASPEAFGSAIGAGLKAVGSGLGQLGESVSAVDQLNSTNRIKKAEVNAAEADRKTLAGDDGYAYTRGGVAVQRKDQALKDLDENTKKFGEGLTPKEQEIYNLRRQERSIQTKGTVYEHSSKERIEDTIDTSKATLDSAADDAVTFFSNPKRLQASIDRGTNEIDAMAPIAGLNSERVKVMKKNFTTKAYTGVITAMAAKDPVGANKFYQDHKDDIDGEQQIKIDAFLKEGVANEESKREAAKIQERETQMRTSPGTIPALTGKLAPVVEQIELGRGLPKGYLGVTGQIESGWQNGRTSSTGAKGIMQFMPKTLKAYPHDVNDPVQSVQAGADLAQDNAKILRRTLGREPSGAELYLAHQQGAGGASKLLANPNAPAASIVGLQAVMVNGGKADMTAGEFASMWLNKYQKVAGGAPIVLGEGRSMTATEGVLDRQKQLDEIQDETVRELTRKRLDALDTALASAAKADKETAQQQLDAIIQRGGTPDDATPSLREAAGLPAVSAAWGFVENRNKRAAPASDEELLYKLRKQAGSDPDGFAQVPLLESRNKLSKEAFDELSKKQQDILAGGHKMKEENANLSAAYSMADQQLKGAGIVGKAPASDPAGRMAEENRVARFQNALTESILEFRKQNERQPSQAEIHDLIARQLLPIIMQKQNDGWFGDKMINVDDMPHFAFEMRDADPGIVAQPNVKITDIDKTSRAMITEDFNARYGRAPSQEELIHEYVLWMTNAGTRTGPK